MGQFLCYTTIFNHCVESISATTIFYFALKYYLDGNKNKQQQP